MVFYKTTTQIILLSYAVYLETTEIQDIQCVKKKTKHVTLSFDIRRILLTLQI